MSTRATDSLVRIPQGEVARVVQSMGKGIKGSQSEGHAKTAPAGFAQILGEHVLRSTPKAAIAAGTPESLQPKSVTTALPAPQAVSEPAIATATATATPPGSRD